MNIDLKKIIQSGLATSVLIRGLSIGLRSLQLLVLVRLYGAGTFGTYAIALGVFNFAMVIGRLGLDHFSLREAASAKNFKSLHLRALSRFMALPGFAAAFCAQILVWLYYSQDVATTFTIFLAAAPIYAITWNHIFILRGYGRIDLSLIIFEILNPIAMILAALFFYKNEFGLAIAFLISTLATLPVTSFFVRRIFDSLDNDQSNWLDIRNSIGQSKNFFASSVVDATQTLADGLFVGYFLHPVDVALYAIITRVSSIVLMPIAILTIYIKNIVSKIRHEAIYIIWKRLRTFNTLSISISLVIWVILVSITPWIGAIFNIEFPISAQWAYVAVVTARALQGASGSVTQALFMSGRERFVARTSLVILAPYLGSLIMLGPTFGIFGVSLIVLANSIISGLTLAILLTLEIKRSQKS